MTKLLSKFVRHFLNDSLYRNSIYLMLNTFVGGLFGLVFWIINTRLFTPAQVGLASALISSLTLISTFSILGLNMGVVRYLPKIAIKSELINTVVTIITLSTVLISSIYLLSLKYFSPKLLFIDHNIFFILTFMCLTLLFTLDTVYSNVFIAFRDTKYTVIKNLVGNIIKVLLPFLIYSLGAYAIFISSTIGPSLTIIISFFILYSFFGYKFKLFINKDILKKISKLSFGNYFASFLAGIPSTILPILIANRLGIKEAAFYYIDANIINLLTTIQSSIGQSLFAESSHNESQLKKHIFNAIKITALILLPIMLFIIFFGKYILLVFGKSYSEEGIILLRILVVSVIFTSVNNILSIILNIKDKIHLLVIMCIVGPIILLGLVYPAVPKGLIPIGYAWLIGEAIISIIYLLLVFLKIK